MTYYGGWTYRFEEAARRGAIEAIIIQKAASRVRLGHGREQRVHRNSIAPLRMAMLVGC